MGIFFDQDWFDGRLEQAGLTRAAMARVTGMTIDEIEMVFSDRRELEGQEIHAIARVLDADPHIVAHNVETVPRLYRRVRREAAGR